MKKTTAFVAAAATASLTIGAVPAAAESMGRANEHCVIHVVGVERSGRFITDRPTCYPTLTEALADAGVPVDSSKHRSFESIERSGVLAQAAGTIGIHWDGANRTGASITISGADCSGGWLNLSNDWTNRISSTWNVCASTQFFDGFDKTGSSEVTGVYSENLGALNNRANSISYGS